MSSLSKMLGLLDLFSPDQPSITPDVVQEAFGLTRATAYRYLKALCDAGLLTRFGGAYRLGPRAIELDYLIRSSDPLLDAGEHIMAEIGAARHCDLQLIGLSGNRILVLNHASHDPGITVSYGRGRTMPMMKGAGGRVVLAQLPSARQKALVAAAEGITPSRLDPDIWEKRRAELSAIRRKGFDISRGELDHGSVGIAVPVPSEVNEDPAALAMIVPKKRFDRSDEGEIVALLHTVAGRIASARDREFGAAEPAPLPKLSLQDDQLIGLPASLAGATPDQQRVVDKITAGPRGSVPSPFLAMLDAPQLTETIQEVGAALRYSSALPDDLREIAILTTAGAVECGYEWNYHASIATAAGVVDTILQATRPGALCQNADEPAATVIELCQAVVDTGEAPPHLLGPAVDRLGRREATEIVAIAGYYALLASFIKSAGFDEPFAAGS
ncbi:IclR family transcriptional regulator domain-containing protein [Parasphingopyxis marina]|uniref:Helix-turn-helix domain-containing protein n=1 Tax=Parasphingopyxis marina TaxID=2761622 RepID=A0A842I2D6_9SPHN|nr:IclR family transcriptional regulator C-terminal domain-containing protein [Parasphingopyxis marina]MBC2778879.1 helix-turn-helix domain-containing protein [Parasphingopyxis marina]